MTLRRILILLALLLLPLRAAALDVPKATGYINDRAGILSAETEQKLESFLRGFEQSDSTQIVVLTVGSLEGESLDEYALKVAESWGIGQERTDNGALLLIAKEERKVRIEVGYGLEGTLTDALSKVIIANAITPRFQAGNFGDGIARGVDDIITVLTTDESEWQKRPSLRLDRQEPAEPTHWFLLALLIAFITLFIVSPGFRWFVLNVLLNILAHSGSSRGGGYSGGGYSGGGGGGGGYSGGGGSSGGGGASGSW
jgi:uncharacterized protein